MSIEKLKRVMWRLDEMFQEAKWDDGTWFGQKALRYAILNEIGTDEETIQLNIDKLVELGWIKRIQKGRWIMLKTSSEL